MHTTLNQFEAEWYKLKADGVIPDVGDVPDVYAENAALERRVTDLTAQLEEARVIATKATATWDQLRRERDSHRMHHKRVGQEKNKLVTDLKRVKAHYANYEPLIKELKAKYETAMKEKMLASLERDRHATKIAALEAELGQESGEGATTSPAGAPATHHFREKRAPVAAGTFAAANSAPKPRTKDVGATGNNTGGAGSATATATATVGGTASGLPATDPANPFAHLKFAPFDAKAARLQKTNKAHEMPVSNLALHPTRPVLVTCSDDKTWKMWHTESGELIMAGEGHRDWVSGADFHPRGTHLVSSSGDMTVKLWDFEKQRCVHTFASHAQAVWSVAFHHTGHFVASGSLDHTARLFDVGTGKCRQVYKGHVDSVNSVCWQPFTSNLCSASSDKTVSVWDGRTGQCAQTYYGHSNSVNHAAFSLSGALLTSCDADGVVKVWDVRMVQEVCSVDAGPTPANRCAFDRSGEIIAVASDSGKVTLHTLYGGGMVAELTGHEDAVQAVLFDHSGESILSAGSDMTFRTWGV